MIDIGRLCVKISGRDAGKKCVVVDKVDKNIVLIDGQARRRKCSIKHLEPLNTLLKIKKGASHADVVKEFSSLKIEVRETKAKKAGKKPQKVRSVKKKPEAKEAPVKKEAKPAKKKTTPKK